MEHQYKVKWYVGEYYHYDSDFLYISAENEDEALKIGKQEMHPSTSVFSWMVPYIRWNIELAD